LTIVTNASEHLDGQGPVLAFLGDPRTHSLTSPIKRIDTHGAIVFLAGNNVYKIKRAIRFSFMDFSTLEKRKKACEAEVAINQPNAPQIYIGVVAITKSSAGFRIGGDGPTVEWAVHMRRFDESMTLDNLAVEGALSAPLMRALADAVVRSHRLAPPQVKAQVSAALRNYIQQNDETFRQVPDIVPPAQAELLRESLLSELVSLKTLLAERTRQGYVRRCHGDLHLRNVTLIDGRPVLFDAIEFDDSIATIDVLYDLAFLIMDIERFGLRPLGNYLFNAYLSDEEDNLDGLAAFPLFLSLRAAVRAKVTALRVPLVDGDKRDDARDEPATYFQLARTLLQHRRPRLVAIGGLSGAGKTTVAAQIAPLFGNTPGAVHLRSDIERKHYFRVNETTRLPPDAYSPNISLEIYERLRRKASRALQAGYSVVVDAVNDLLSDREAFEQVAAKSGASFAGIWLEAPLERMIERIGQRVNDASDADAAVVRAQAATDIGPMSWSRIDAAGDRPQVIEKVRRQLGI
jgi:aminoglycoside phosphotransferase family enzyme/predicted kinase